ncbi:hypothetical protein QJQ45_022615 [Haematococcus lacustris]|nr:hypothetical protein QJQ45_022615 [Haematococcus lacustris]
MFAVGDRRRREVEAELMIMVAIAQVEEEEQDERARPYNHVCPYWKRPRSYKALYPNNTMHSKARVKVEHAWDCLKNKFQCCRLGIRTDVKVALIMRSFPRVMVFMCCCKLHNICIDHGEDVPEGVDPDAIQVYEDRLAEDGVGLDRRGSLTGGGVGTWRTS